MPARELHLRNVRKHSLLGTIDLPESLNRIPPSNLENRLSGFFRCSGNTEAGGIYYER